jgi:hypothetical protein
MQASNRAWQHVRVVGTSHCGKAGMVYQLPVEIPSLTESGKCYFAAFVTGGLSVADPDPGSGAFLTPGSGMNNPDHIF